MSGTELDRVTTPIQIMLDLEADGMIDAVSLNLTDPDMAYEQWESIGVFLGSLGRRVNWYVGDWLNFGSDLYGEQASQGIEATTKERYSESARVTGLDHGTLLNISSICRKIARSRRRPELGFWIHAEVAPLDPEEQVEWLARAIDEGWNRGQLREAIREAKHGTVKEDGDGGGDGGGGGVSRSEQVETAARLVWHAAQSTTDGSFLVPAEAMSQLASALGEG